MRKIFKFLNKLFYQLKSPVFAGLFVFVVFSGCTNSSTQIGKKPVVEVNGVTLNAKEFADILAKKMVRFDALAAKDPSNLNRAKEEIVQDFVMSSLIKSWAIQNGVETSEKELDLEVDKIRSGFPNDLAFRRELAQSGQSFQQWKASLSNSILEKKVFTKITEKIEQPTDADILKYYELNKDKFKRAESVYLRQIVLKESSDAEKVLEALKTKSFELMAKEFSIAPESKDGGLVGWVEKGTVDFFDKAFSIGVGSLSDIIQSPFGFHILKIEKKMASGFKTLDESKKSILQVLKSNREQAAFSAWLDSQLRNSKILRNNDIIRGMSVETRKE